MVEETFEIMTELLREHVRIVRNRGEVKAMEDARISFRIGFVCDPHQRCAANTTSLTLDNIGQLEEKVRRRVMNRHGDPDNTPTDWWYDWFVIYVSD